MIDKRKPYTESYKQHYWLFDSVNPKMRFLMTRSLITKWPAMGSPTIRNLTTRSLILKSPALSSSEPRIMHKGRIGRDDQAS